MKNELRTPVASRSGLKAEGSLCILQVNTQDLGGGAAKVAWDLFAAFRARGHYSRLAVGYRRGEEPDVLVLPNDRLRRKWSRFWLAVSASLQPAESLSGASGKSVPRSRTDTVGAGFKPAPTEANLSITVNLLDGPLSRLASFLSRLTRGLADPARSWDIRRGVEDFRYPGARHLLALLEHAPDIVHCHNLHGYYFDLRSLSYLSRRMPVVLTLHDAWLLSGHCAHSFGCERWKSGCGDCPDLSIYPPISRDATGQNWRRKRSIYAQSRFNVATPSSWLMRKVEESMLEEAVVEARVIPNGVDLSIFRPGSSSASRSILGIPQDAKVLLFAANGIRDNRWKDYRTMRAAISEVARTLPDEPTLLLALGEDAPPERIGSAQIRFVPYQAEAETMALYFQAADVYVHAARADTFPNTVLEALACGAPVVATAVGGIPEQIEDGVTGFLVPEGDVEALAGRLRQALAEDGLRQRMGIAAAESARLRFDFSRSVDSYLDWYFELAENRGGLR